MRPFYLANQPIYDIFKKANEADKALTPSPPCLFCPIIFMASKKFIKEIKKELMAEKKRIVEELEKFTHADEKDKYESDFPQYGDKMDENAMEVSAFSSNLSLEKRLEANLQSIEKALENIAKEKYGICEICQNEIHEDRLKAFPSATICKECIKQVR